MYVFYHRYLGLRGATIQALKTHVTPHSTFAAVPAGDHGDYLRKSKWCKCKCSSLPGGDHVIWKDASISAELG
ncbi:MAG: hypothetical protein RIE24_11895 [Silicimonas sp.]